MSERTSGRGPLSQLAVLVAVTGAVLLAVWLWRPTLVESTLSSPRAIAFIVIAVGVAAGVRLLVTRWTGSRVAGRFAQAVPMAVVLALVIIPSVRPTTVDESLPPAGPPPAAAPAPAPPAMHAAPAPPAAPRELASAVLAGIDHHAEGTVRLIALPGGSQLVRFEDFSVEPGPDYHVHLVPGPDQQSPDGPRIDSLKGTEGNQNYPVPAGAEPSGPVTVLIWCRAFAVPVASASMVL